MSLQISSDFKPYQELVQQHIAPRGIVDPSHRHPWLDI